MATMNISLPDDLKAFVDAQVAEHAYGSTSEYLRELIRKQRDVAKVRALLMEGFGSGPAQEADATFFAQLREVAKGRSEP